jgi:hypothetical protein
VKFIFLSTNERTFQPSETRRRVVKECVSGEKNDFHKLEQPFRRPAIEDAVLFNRKSNHLFLLLSGHNLEKLCY